MMGFVLARMPEWLFGAWLAEKSAQSMVLGRDHRTSSKGLADAFSRGVRSHGVDVISIGVVPTPICFFQVELTCER